MRIFHIFGIAIMMSILASCSSNKPSYCYPGKRCDEYQTYTRCGSYLKHECEDICAPCKAYEPECYSCLACIENSPQKCNVNYNYNDGFAK